MSIIKYIGIIVVIIVIYCGFQLRLTTIGCDTILVSYRQSHIPVTLVYPIAKQLALKPFGWIWQLPACAYAKPNGTYPLIIFSHGYKGHPLELFWLMEIFAKHGFMVASLTHDDSFVSSGMQPAIDFWQRPQQVTAVLHDLLSGQYAAYIRAR